jgi:hypothetical protein
MKPIVAQFGRRENLGRTYCQKWEVGRAEGVLSDTTGRKS